MNFYEYVGSRPTLLADPFGKKKCIAVVNNFAKAGVGKTYSITAEPAAGGYWEQIQMWGDWAAQVSKEDPSTVKISARGVSSYEKYLKQWSQVLGDNVVTYGWKNVYFSGESVSDKESGVATCKLSGAVPDACEISASSTGGNDVHKKEGYFGFGWTLAAAAYVFADVNADSTQATFHVGYAAGMEETLLSSGRTMSYKST